MAGLLHVVIGIIAIAIGLHARGVRADQEGALRSIAELPGGIVVLVAMIAGLLALALWHVVQAATVREPDLPARWRARAVSAGLGLGYLALGLLGVSVAVGVREDDEERTLTAALLAAPAGVLLIVAIGLAVLGGGAYFVVKGARRGFLRDLVPIPRRALRDTVEVVGVIGHVAKGIALALLGVLLVIAAVTADPDQAGGLDEAFQAIARVPFGELLVILTGTGFIAYGVYCGFRARLARL